MSVPTNTERLSPEVVKESFLGLPLSRLIANENKNSLENTVILHINHALSDVFAINDILNSLGAKVFFISTPYNNVYYKNSECDYLFTLRDENSFQYFINGKSITFNIKAKNIVEAIHLTIKFALKYINEKQPGKEIILLQDGGYSAAESNIIQEDPFFEMPNFLGVVEQTQGGTRLFYKKSQNQKIKYPIVTISRSLIKMRVESHFIAKRILEEVNYALYKKGYFLNFKNVTIGGYGTIGRQLARYITKENSKVTVIENHRHIKDLAQKEGYTVSDRLSKIIFDKNFCYIGCTGKCTFDIEALLEFMESKNKYFIIASGSSKRAEFDIMIRFFEDEEFQKKSIKEYPALKEITNLKKDGLKNGVVAYKFQYHTTAKEIIVLAEGYPINLYYHEVQSVPDRAIDPIQALLIYSVIKLNQNHNKLKNGLNHLSDSNVSTLLNIDEGNLLKKWCYLNDIAVGTADPFDLFEPHPLEELLIGLY